MPLIEKVRERTLPHLQLTTSRVLLLPPRESSSSRVSCRQQQQQAAHRSVSSASHHTALHEDITAAQRPPLACRSCDKACSGLRTHLAVAVRYVATALLQRRHHVT